jgi:hypothetical protein
MVLFAFQRRIIILLSNVFFNHKSFWILENMTEKDKVSELSKLLEDVEKHVLRCDVLDPWAAPIGRVCAGDKTERGRADRCGLEAREVFLQACLGGTALIARLAQTDPDIVGKFKRLKALPQLDADDLSALESPTTEADRRRAAQIWGQTLELTADLKGAAKFCVSLAEEEKAWGKKLDKRIEFSQASQKLAGFLLYDLLDVLAEYEPDEYAALRLQVINSYLKELRVEFLWDGHVRGPCRTDSIPGQCEFENLPDNLKGELTVVHGGRQHELMFSCPAAGEFECRVNNTGLENYRALLDSIWDHTTGKLPSHPRDGSAVWAFTENECIQNLEAYASLITDLLKPLSPLSDYSDCARAIRALLRKGRGCWAKMTHIEWSYLGELDKLITELDGKPKPFRSA